jgi:1-acyl-sn-glycerol-3-phosphate acyltransferase
VIGRLIRGSGTLFIERARRHDTERVNRSAVDALRSGDAIVVFPEGTTTDGTTVLKFHGSLLQPIVDARGHLLPVAIRYHDGKGSLSLAPEYAGDTSFATSFWRVCGARRLAVDLIVSAPMPAAAVHRRELARAAESAIRTALAAQGAATAPGARDDPRA